MRKAWLIAILAISLPVLGQNAAPNPPPPPLPSDLPVSAAAPNQKMVAPKAFPNTRGNSPAVRPRNPNLPLQRAINQLPQPGQPVQAQPFRAIAPNAPTGEVPLTWDSVNKEYTAKPGEFTAHFEFAVTNNSPGDVTINWVRPSCGCTVAKLPPIPWKLAPGDGGTIALDVDFRGKYGILSKYVSVDTSHGVKMLNIKVNIPAQSTASAGIDRRTQNMQIAMADRQAVFKNDCASCHVAPAIGRKGQQLFSAACGICHEAPHRATMVPDLAALKIIPTKEYWLHWITNGKEGTLMPAFGQQHGGPLTDEQIESLAEYLTHYYPPRKVASTAPTPAAED